MSDTDAVAWLRQQVEGDRARWQNCGAAMRYRTLCESGAISTGLPAPQMAADLDEARDRVADCEAKLAILADLRDHDEHVARCLLPLLACAYRHREGYADHWHDPV